MEANNKGKGATKTSKAQVPNSGRLSKEVFEKETRQYFESIKVSPVLFIEVRKAVAPYVYLDIRNLIVLLIYETFGLQKWIKLCIICNGQSECKDNVHNGLSEAENHLASLRLRTSVVFEETTKICSNYPKDLNKEQENLDLNESNTRKHPSVDITDRKMIICGLSSVLRFMLKFVCFMLKSNCTSDGALELDLLLTLKQYLGFRGGCLQACAESSIWTKFCEVDMLDVVNQIYKISTEVSCKPDKAGQTNDEPITFIIPKELVRFEHHLSLPVKIHNYQKVVQDIKKASQAKVTLGKFSINQVNTDLQHEFAEGPTMLLSDLILFPSMHVCVTSLGRVTLESLLPKCMLWYDRVYLQFSKNSTFELNNECFVPHHARLLSLQWSAPEVPSQSLYLRDTNRYKPTLRQFTRQYEVVEALEFLKCKAIVPLEIHEEEPDFQWSEIPLLAHPEGGSLPITRRQRKCDQLASLAYYALKIYNEKRRESYVSKGNRFRIVDFCSGGGHLGILVAWLLPECDIILVENKDESLRRAQERIAGLGLSNIFCFQSNLDYFEGDFDLGMALHACGTATDLVLAKCVSKNASFVCCPCCYGAVQENHILSYPRSSNFLQVEIPSRYYFIVCHASDQTHDVSNDKTEQGKQCMAYVDTDRCLYAADHGYNVKLCKIVPETASPKNHILVGISSNNI